MTARENKLRQFPGRTKGLEPLPEEWRSPAGQVRVALGDGKIHIAIAPAFALCGHPRRATGDVAAEDAAVSCDRCALAVAKRSRR